MESDLLYITHKSPPAFTTDMSFLLRKFYLKPHFSLKLPQNPRKKSSSYSTLRGRFSVSADAITIREVTRKGAPGSGKQDLKRYSAIFRECASRGDLNGGESVHGGLIKSGFVPDSHLWVSLSNFYAKCGRAVFALKVLDEMPQRDVVSWTAVVSGFVNEGCGIEGVSGYSQMRRDNVRPNEFAFATVLKACSLCLDFEFGTQVHAEVIKAGLVLDLFVGCAIVDFYGKCGEVELAGGVFSDLPEKNGVSWNVLLNGYTQRGDVDEVLKLFSRMMESGVLFSAFDLSTLLKGCASSEKLREGKVFHSMAIRSGCEVDEFLGSSLVDMYCKCGMAGDALKVFNRMKDHDVVAWSAMIAGLEQQGKSYEAAEMFRLMMQRGARPNQFSLSSVVSAATSMGDLSIGESSHACVWKLGFESDNAIGNSLIMMYTRNGCVQDGYCVFEAMTVRDIVTWNSLLSGLTDLETCDQGPRVFRRMIQEGFKPNVYTFSAVLRSCSSLLDVDLGKQVHAYIIKNRNDEDDLVRMALIDMYARNRCMEDAIAVFNELTKRDVFAWTVIISGYAQTDRAEKAVKYLRQMQRENVKPNEFTLASSLSGCSHMATPANGHQLHSMAIKSGHFDDVFVATALVDMYEKCGCMEDAEAIFRSLVSRDTISWNTIISGYSRHGQGEKALEAFRMMLVDGCTPDESTFLGVLSTCSHMGWVEKGKEIFDSISRDCSLKPSIEHCACMVDMLGRAGKFSDIERYIEKMELANNSLIWETILGACQLHGNVELGETATRKLLEMEPKMDSTYILLSNIFAAKGQWEDVKGIRKLMTDTGVKKEPGCSWIEVDGQVHKFVSRDGSHPVTKEIYAKVEELREKLVAVGSLPKTENVLRNVMDRE